MIIELVIPAVVMMVILNLLFSRWSYQKMAVSVKDKFKARPHTRSLISRFRDFTRFMVVFTIVWIPVFMTVYYLLAEYFAILSPYDPYWLLLFLVGIGFSIVYVLRTEEKVSII
jgi:hypothetical protein